MTMTVDRRIALAGLLTLPILLEGCPGKTPPAVGTPPATPADMADVPEDGTYRFDFGAELQSIP